MFNSVLQYPSLCTFVHEFTVLYVVNLLTTSWNVGVWQFGPSCRIKGQLALTLPLVSSECLQDCFLTQGVLYTARLEGVHSVQPRNKEILISTLHRRESSLYLYTFILTPSYEESSHSEPEPKGDHQIVCHNSHVAESQDQKRGKHGDSGSSQVKSSQFYLYSQYHKSQFASKGFTICTPYETRCP